MTKDKFIGILLMIFGFIFLYLTYSMDFVAAEGAASTPRTFPYIACWTIIICAFVLFFRKDKNEGEKKPFFTKEGYKNVVILLGVMFMFPLFIEILGLAIVMPLAVFLMVMLFSKNKDVSMKNKVVFTAAFSVSMYILFVQVLGIIFPMGILDGIL